MKKYFSVKTKCGHVGKYNCVWINFAICAESAKEAVVIVKKIGRVKRHHKDFIYSIQEIDFDTFIKLKAQNDLDPYLHCKNIQQQRALKGFEERIEIDEYNIAKKCGNSSKKDSREYRRKKSKEKVKSCMLAMKEFFYEEAIAW